MRWIIKPNVFESGHEGFAVGDKVLIHGHALATVATPEEHEHICSIYYNNAVRFIPVKYDDGRVTGWRVRVVTLVERPQRMRIEGNELHLDAP